MFRTNGGLLTTGDISSIILGGMSDKGSPSTTDIKQSITLLQGQLLADHVELVVLQLRPIIYCVDKGDYTTSVDHSWSQEPRVDVVASVVVVPDLVLVLALRVDEDLGNKVGEDVFEEL